MTIITPLSVRGESKVSADLFAAVKNTDIKSVKKFLKTTSPKTKDEFGRNAIHYSASRITETGDDVNITKLILAKDRTEEEDEHGNTALHHASFFGNLDIATYLLANGYSNKENKDGITPLNIAEKNGDEDMTELIIDCT